MSTTTTRPARNGVDVPTLFATVDAVRARPEAAAFRFRATNRWVSGTHSRSTMDGFFGTGQELTRETPFTADSDHPPVLVGDDVGPTPTEWVLHALAACLTGGIANIAAARGIDLTSVESSVEGDMDLQGVLGLADDVRNGFTAVRVSFRVVGDADDAVLQEVVEQSKARSAVLDLLTDGVAVEVVATTA